MIKFILNIIFWGLALGAAGTLVDATRDMGKAAAKAHQTGLISLSTLNRTLTSP